MSRRRTVFAVGASCALLAASCNLVIGLTHEPALDGSIGGGDAQQESSDAPQGDACASCQPTAIATGLPGPFLLAQWGTELYWTDLIAGDIEAASKSAVDASSLIFNGPMDFPFAIAADDSGVYFTESGFGGEVVQCPFTGCPTANANDNYLALGGMTNTDIALQGGYVYWLQANGDELDRILEADASGNPVKTATTSTSSALNVVYLSRIATDGTSVYWSQAPNDKIVGSVIGSNVNSKLFLFSAGSTPSAIHYDNGMLYFATLGATNGTGAVYYGSPDGGGGAQMLASGQQYPYWITTDATYVYWTTEGDFPDDGGNAVGNGGVYRCKKTGCNGTPDQLASNLVDARGIVVDDTAIYFTTFGTGNKDGAVWRLPKPP